MVGLSLIDFVAKSFFNADESHSNKGIYFEILISEERPR